jgi:hypothetical protein
MKSVGNCRVNYYAHAVASLRPTAASFPAAVKRADNPGRTTLLHESSNHKQAGRIMYRTIFTLIIAAAAGNTRHDDHGKPGGNVKVLSDREITNETAVLSLSGTFRGREDFTSRGRLMSPCNRHWLRRL